MNIRFSVGRFSLIFFKDIRYLCGIACGTCLYICNVIYDILKSSKALQKLMKLIKVPVRASILQSIEAYHR